MKKGVKTIAETKVPYRAEMSTTNVKFTTKKVPRMYDFNNDGNQWILGNLQRILFFDDRLIEVTCVFGKVPRSRPQSAAAARWQGDLGGWGMTPWAVLDSYPTQKTGGVHGVL